MQDYTRIEGTQIEFLCPSEFSFDNGCYSSEELKAGICFHAFDGISEESINKRTEIYEKEKVIRRIPIKSDL